VEPAAIVNPLDLAELLVVVGVKVRPLAMNGVAEKDFSGETRLRRTRGFE